MADSPPAQPSAIARSAATPAPESGETSSESTNQEPLEALGPLESAPAPAPAIQTTAARKRPRRSTAAAAEGGMSIDEFTSLASKLANLGLYREAIKLYQTASQLHPENLALKINLARVRDMKRRADAEILKEFDSSIKALRAREDQLANQYLGLAHLHYRRGDLDRARDYFEFARVRNEVLFDPAFHLARLAIDKNDKARAIRYLEEARHANPFSEETLDVLGGLYMERGDNEPALHAYLDALVLCGDAETGEKPSFYNQRLRELIRRLGRDPRNDLPELIRERTARFTALAEKLEQRRRDALHERSPDRLQNIFARYSARVREEEPPQVDLSSYRKYKLFDRIDDSGLYQVVRRLQPRKLSADEAVFTEGESTDCLFLLEAGSLRIRKNTPLGEHVLTTISPGEVFGEMNFLDERPHSADAIANQDSDIFVLARHDADMLIADRRDLAVQFYSYFWRTLAQRIRATNEKMKSFFVSEAMNTERQLAAKELADAEQVIVDIDKKIAIFREKGLSGRDLELLAGLSNEEMYNKEDLIFQEGDPGGKLYIVLEGKVRISKSIPGVGEEALSILERGDFFGEMSLVDDQPRSADARVHEERTTVISIDKAALEDILTTDVNTAFQFLGILCRILAQRLREINETIVKWRIMSGGFA